jgi:hypothetical protein
MKFLVATVALLMSPSAVWGSMSFNPLVECSTITTASSTPFEVCATSIAYGPSPASIDGKVIYMGGYGNDYKIVTGLKKGVDTTALSESDAKKAYGQEIGILVERDDKDKCKVTVNVKGDSKVCTSCTFCGKDRYSADCTGVKNGRKVTCESTGAGEVFFPLVKLALEPKLPDLCAPTAPVKPPVKPWVRAPTKPPIKAPVAAPKK